MTKYLAIGSAIIIIGLGLLVYFQERRIIALNKTVVKLEAVKAACEQQAKIYKDWGEIDHATSAKIKQVPGDPAAIANALTELFGGKPVPAPAGTTGGTGQAKP